jgi:hypothetical protein
MAVTTKRVSYAYLKVDDKPGEAARILGALQKAGVNLLAFTGFGTGGGKAKLTLIPESAEALRAGAGKAGLSLGPVKECFLVQGDDRPGAGFEVLQRLAEARVNCTAASGAADGRGRFGMMVFVKQPDLAAAAKALGA